MAVARERYGFGPQEFELSQFDQQNQLDSLIAEMADWAKVITDSGRLEKYLEQTKNQKVNSTVLPSGLALICLSEFSVLKKPIKHDYSHLFTGDTEADERITSHALHHIDGFAYKGHRIWLHDLDKHTSEHAHNKFEIERVLHGKIKTDGVIIQTGETHIVPPNTLHPVQVYDGPAIMLCTLMNGAQEDFDEIHKLKINT